MATADSVKAKLQGQIDKINATTGGTDATLADAVDTVIAGFGQGGGLDIDTGTITPTENIRYVTLPVSKKRSQVVLWLTEPEKATAEYMTEYQVCACYVGEVFACATIRNYDNSAITGNGALNRLLSCSDTEMYIDVGYSGTAKGLAAGLEYQYIAF